MTSTDTTEIPSQAIIRGALVVGRIPSSPSTGRCSTNRTTTSAAVPGVAIMISISGRASGLSSPSPSHSGRHTSQASP